MRGYFGIGIYRGKDPLNIGTLWRSAYNLGAAYIFTIGQRYKHERADTCKVPRHIPLYFYETADEFFDAQPDGAKVIAIEQSPTSRDLVPFRHPERAAYLLGAEDAGIPESILVRCSNVVHIESPMCLNVAVAGSIVMWDRQAKATAKTKQVAA